MNTTYIQHLGIIKESLKAVLIHMVNKDVWIPLSVIECRDDRIGVLGVSSWFADKNGLKGAW